MAYWRCPSCSRINDATSYKCSCRYVVGLTEQKQYIDSKITSELYRNQQDEWLCPSCQRHNKTARQCSCGYEIGRNLQLYWKCPRCNSLNYNDSCKCSCGFLISPSEQRKYKFEQSFPNAELNNLEAYKAWQAQITETTQKKTSNSIICPYCDENIPESSTKCPYCAEEIEATKISEKTYRKVKEEPSAVEPPSTEIAKSSNLSFQDNNLDKTSSANQSEHDSAGELKKKIMKLEKLLSEGILSKEEFKSKREQLINEYLNE